MKRLLCLLSSATKLYHVYLESVIITTSYFSKYFTTLISLYKEKEDFMSSINLQVFIYYTFLLLYMFCFI